MVIIMAVRLSALAESLTFYLPSRESFLNEPGVEDVWVSTPDGVKLHAWFLRAADAKPGEKRAAVFHCHGNAGNVSSHLAFSRFLTERGMHVFIFDYRGYGRSDPARFISRSVLRVDALAAFDALAVRRDVDAARIDVYGVSLGGAFALTVAAERPAARCICTLSAFSSFPAVASDHFPFIGSLLIPTGLAGTNSIAKLGPRPLLLAHGGQDTIVHAAHADVLSSAARAESVPVQLAIIAEAGHNDIIEHAQTRDVIAEFFNQHLSK